jgi:hypothetical protein
VQIALSPTAFPAGVQSKYPAQRSFTRSRGDFYDLIALGGSAMHLRWVTSPERELERRSYGCQVSRAIQVSLWASSRRPKVVAI